MVVAAFFLLITALQGAAACEDGCWKAVQQLPKRICECVENTCLNPGETTCFPCNQAYNVYKSEEECLAEGKNMQHVGTGVNSSVYPTGVPDLIGGVGLCDGREVTTSGGRQNCPWTWPGLKRWDRASTWPGGRVPTPGSTVTLPPNSRVLLAGCAFPSSRLSLRQIIIPAGSELVVAQANLFLVVSSIIVRGKLWIGGPTCRMWSTVRISFPPAATIPMSDYGLLVQGGAVAEVHGTRFTPAWTRLAATARRGQSTIVVKEATNWRSGQYIFITTSIWRDEVSNQNEVVQIVRVGADRKTITLAYPLSFNHYGGGEYQCEVGLITRDVVLEGTAAVESTRRGPHTIILPGAQGRFRGVLAYRMGQYNTQGRYPFHWHMVGDGRGQYMQDCSVYRSFYRCFTIHGTNNVLLQNNVAFHAFGNCYYLEGGVEENNILDGNLAAYVHVVGTPGSGWNQGGSTHYEDLATQEQPADAASSGFYISNARNTITGNAASGGFAGFNIPNLPNGIRAYRSASFVPSQRTFIKFDGNTAHSSGYHWLEGGCIYVGGLLYHGADGRLVYNLGRNSKDSRDRLGNQAWDKFTNTKVWLCNKGITHWGDRPGVVGYTAYDQNRGAELFGRAYLSQGLISLWSNNPDSEFSPVKILSGLQDFPAHSAFQFYDTGTLTIITRMTFQNYRYKGYSQLPNRPTVFFTMTHSDVFKPSFMSLTAKISYRNVDPEAILWVYRINTGSAWSFNFQDMDGSASLWPGTPTIVGSFVSWWRTGNNCRYQPTWNSWVCARRGDQSGAVLNVRVNNDMGAAYSWGLDTNWRTPPIDPTDATWSMGYISQWGYRGDQIRMTPLTRNEGNTGVTGDNGWYVYLNRGAPRNLQVFITQLPIRGQYLLFSTRYPAGTTFQVRRELRWYSSQNLVLTRAGSRAEMLSSRATKYFFDGRYLQFQMTEPGDPTYSKYSPFSYDGYTLTGNRYFDAWYRVIASCAAYDGFHCRMTGPRAECDVVPGLRSTVQGNCGPGAADVPEYQVNTTLEVDPAASYFDDPEDLDAIVADANMNLPEISDVVDVKVIPQPAAVSIDSIPREVRGITYRQLGLP